MIFPTLPGAASPLVGREREQATLCEHLAAALAGRGDLVLIGGEAGIGKTTLAEGVCRGAADAGALVLAGRCYDLSETPPYGPWLEVFGHYRAVDGLPPLPDAFARRGAIEGGANRAALFDQVDTFLRAVTARRPLVLLLDDLHWADPASLDLLRFISRALATRPLLLIATYRTEEVTRPRPLYRLLPVLAHEASAARLTVQPLTDRDVFALIAARYRLAPEDAARLVVYLHDRAEGNPFYLSELLRALEEGGSLRADADHWIVGDLTRARVPPLLRQVIDGRLARLGEEAQMPLAVAAVIGQEVPLALWARVSGCDEESLSPVIERAIDAHILAETAAPDRVCFAHALTREALYEGSALTRRRAWHRLIGEAEAARTDADPDTVAYHFRQAGDARAAEWLFRSGVRAGREFATQTATERLEAALALLTSQDARNESLSPQEAGERGALIAHIRFNLGQRHCIARNIRQGLGEMRAAVATLATIPAADHPRTAALLHSLAIPTDRRIRLLYWLTPTGHYREARALAEEIGAGIARPATATPGEWTDYGFAHFSLGMAHAALGYPEAARRAYAEARAGFAAADYIADVAYTALQELLWVTLPYFADRLAERRRLAAEGERLAAQARHLPPGTPRIDTDIRSFSHLPLLAIEGQWDEARAIANASLALGIGGGTRAIPSRIVGPLARAQGEAERAWVFVHEELPAGPETEPGETIFPTSTALQRLAAALATDAGDLPLARAWLEAHDRWLAWSGAALGQSEGAALWAEYHREAGDTGQAFRHAERALAHASEPRQPLALLAAHRLLGVLDTAAGRYEDAAAHLDDALALADACAARYERALTLLARAELRAAIGSKDDARALLDEVRTICTPLGAAPALARADALAARLATPASATTTHPNGLTEREVDVLRLIAAGRSNREIAAALFISERTVNRHITNLYTKIDAHSKADATAYALRNRLA